MKEETIMNLVKNENINNTHPITLNSNKRKKKSD